MDIRRFLIALLVPAVLIVVGTFGYVAIEGWSVFDGLYMTVMTITTVGFTEVHEMSPAGRSFTLMLMLGGIFTLFYAAGAVIQAVVSGQLQNAFGRQRMERNLAGLHDHMIVCGFGRMGRLVCQHFSEQHIPFVVVECNADVVDGMQIKHGLTVLGDATSDETLRKAGVERARALVTLVASDSDNLYITMSTRLINETIFIVARAEDERAEQKLLRAGASKVVSPYIIGGSRVAQAVLRPAVVDFIELATRTEHLELQIEETRIGASSKLAGKNLIDSQLRKRFGVILVAIKKTGGKMMFNPPGEAVLEVGDLLIVLGPRAQLDELDRLAGG